MDKLQEFQWTSYRFPVALKANLLFDVRLDEWVLLQPQLHLSFYTWLKYALVGGRIGGWWSILKARSNILQYYFGDHFGHEVLKVMLWFCLVDVWSLVAYWLPLPLSYPKKESWWAQWRKQKPIWICISEFVYVNLLVQLHTCKFTYTNSLYDIIYVNLCNLWILIIQIIFSSIVHKGYFHGHDTLPLHGKTRSAIDEQTENGSKKTPPTTHSNVRWRKRIRGEKWKPQHNSC
jgi:hypothetical protein